MKRKSMLWIFLLLIIVVAAILYLKKRGTIAEETTETPETKTFKDRLKEILTPVVITEAPSNGPTWYLPKENGEIFTGFKPRPENGLTLEEERIIDRDLLRLQTDSGPYIYQRQWRE